jgi:hypothetical protein
MRTQIAIVIVGFGLLLMAGPLAAHHSFSAEFDVDQPVTLRGNLTKMEWTNPHCWFYVDVKGKNGEMVNWAVEAGTPNALLRLGFTKNTLAAGSAVVVEGYRAKDESNRANGFNLTTADGRKLFLGSTVKTGAPSDKK